MDDGIDQTQWLRPNEAAETVLRASARSGKQVIYNEAGRLQACIPALPTVLEHMDERELLTGEEVSTCREFAACRLGFEVQLGVRTARYADQLPSGQSCGAMADAYRKVLRNASRKDCELAMWAHETPCSRAMWKAVYDNKARIAEALGRIRDAFDAPVVAI